jgi:hypothetical protein
MKKTVHPKAFVRRTKYEKLLSLLCLLKVIPLIIGKNKVQGQFRILSLPILLSTLWCWIPLSYYIFSFAYANWITLEYTEVNSNELYANASKEITNSSVIDKGFYMFMACEGTELLMILLLPATLGYFFACNELMRQKKFAWSKRTWILVISAVLFPVSETTSFFAFSYETTGLSTWAIVYNFTSDLLINVIACLFQLTALLLVSSRQAYFMKNAAKNCKTTTCSQINHLLQEYEYIKSGTAPLYAVEFCLHTPMILCFAYFGLSNPQFLLCLWSSGKIAWSSLTLIHICLISEDCFDALQGLLPAIGYATFLY